MKTGLRVAVVLLALQAFLWADRIHLKDGTTLTADSVTESHDRVDYTVGGTGYSLPKSSVSSIERGTSTSFGISIGTSQSGWIAAPAHPALAVPSPGDSKASHRELAAALSAEPAKVGAASSALAARIIHESGVSESALREVDAEGNPATSAAAYFLAARYAYNHSDGDAARKYMKRSLELEPSQASLLEGYSMMLLDAGQNDEAVAQAQRAVKQEPKSANALDVLGMACYDAGRFDEAIDNWKRAQKLHPNNFISGLIGKAQRESAVEGKFDEREGTHFVLRYEGAQTGIHFASDLLYSLERQYASLQRDLGAPEITITVILYTEKQFFSVTEAPSWSDGLNDGKIRVPVQNLTGVTPQLEAVLRHEMTHSFIRALTHGRCPTWLNEGVAQMEEPRDSSRFAEPLAQLFREGKAVPLHFLEGSFMRLSPQQAQLAYAESLAAAEYFRSAYGMYDLRRMLELLNEGEAPEAALQQATGTTYQDFENGLGSYLASSSR